MSNGLVTIVFSVKFESSPNQHCINANDKGRRVKGRDSLFRFPGCDCKLQ